MKKIISSLGALFIVCSMNAQINVGGNLVFSYPNGNFGDIAAPAVGGGVEFNFFLGNNIALGIEASYTDFGDNDNSVFDVDMDIVPISVKMEYYLTETQVRPFIGVGVGYYLVDGSLHLGNPQNRLDFDLNGIGVTPRFGVLYNFTETSGVVLNMQYNAMFGQDYDNANLKALLDPLIKTSYFNFSLGYRFTL